MLEHDNGDFKKVGFILRTPRGFDAVAQTTGYTPERATNDWPTIEEAMAFVESFNPWEDFGGGADLVVEAEVRARAS